MQLPLATLIGFLGFLIFRFIEKYFPRYYLSFSDLVLGEFRLLELFSSILIPFSESFIFGIFVKSGDLWVYVLPGFLTALLAIWPVVRIPALLPENLYEKRQSVFASYFLFTISFSALSFIGGISAQPLSL